MAASVVAASCAAVSCCNGFMKRLLSLHCACYDPSSAARNDVSLTFTAFQIRQKVSSVQGCSFLKIAEKERKRKRKLVRSSDSLAGKLD